MREMINFLEYEDYLIHFLKSIRLNELKINNEEELETKLIILMKKDLTLRKKKINRQEKNSRFRVLKPDIIIGDNDYLIELKFLRNNSINDIYRLFYQAVKYSKIATKRLIFFIFDPKFKLNEEDKRDLISISRNLLIIHKH